MSDSRQKGRQRSSVVEQIDSMQPEGALPSNNDRRRWPRQQEIAPETSLALPALEPLLFSTRDMAQRDQFNAWKAYVAPLVDVTLPETASLEEGFPADHTVWNLDSMLVVQQCAPAHSYARSAAMLRSNSIDHWHIVVLRAGRTWTEVDGRVSQGELGKVEMRSLGYPFRGRATQSKTLSFYLPRELFSNTAASTEIKNNIVLSGIYTNLLIEYLDGVEAKLSSLTSADLPQVVQTTRDMILTCASSSTQYFGPAEQSSTTALMERVRRFVKRNLGSPDLTPDKLCRELGISRTRLYQLLEPNGGVHHYIQRRRLLSAHAAISNFANREQIVEIAFAFGFTSAAHFSRAFSKEFGYSPREARNVAVPPYLAHAATLSTGSIHSFDNWLKGLGH